MLSKSCECHGGVEVFGDRTQLMVSWLSGCSSLILQVARFVFFSSVLNLALPGNQFALFLRAFKM